MIITRASLLKRIQIQSVKRLTTVSDKVENVGPVVFHKLGGDDRGIAVYGLNSPRDKNALGFDLLQSMKEVNQLIREDTKISVVILHSLVKGIFCAGANLKERFKMNDDEVARFVRTLRNTFIEIEDLPMPTIAAVEGVAVGGGLELALACDIRIAAETAKLGLVETGRGLIPGAGGTQRLPRVIHPNIAKELIFTSRIVSGKEAKDLGVVNHVVPQNSSHTAAYERAVGVAREIISNAPIALRCAKQAINEGVQLSIKDGYEVEQKCYEKNIPTQDRREGMLSFIEKRKPQYKGH
ncbi:enoyl-CoA hydratase domain-containing protein 2, mitochondrial [Bicyclus anynana]|uniref:Enoyl-CoA hydratase domain-containing protein 2, mitochondrial n=1 Tax=Bicyclus anynana TaxID=110368 RepID=A0A6J1NLH9_BICAN|nr:enoyl-CoA hydratase domain-containing protein 2, mitochondrial [Bicyclus anynana]XP_023945848.2 enoyl-CoA hydratase domain-containing protein 2, mitochondrial [Bicyclus anynana]